MRKCEHNAIDIIFENIPLSRKMQRDISIFFLKIVKDIHGSCCLVSMAILTLNVCGSQHNIVFIYLINILSSNYHEGCDT